jgi:hypothetical protein
MGWDGVWNIMAFEVVGCSRRRRRDETEKKRQAVGAKPQP